MDKPGRKRATLIQWLCIMAIVAVCGAILYRQVWEAWYGGSIPGWYAAYLTWQQRHGIPEWFPF